MSQLSMMESLVCDLTKALNSNLTTNTSGLGDSRGLGGLGPDAASALSNVVRRRMHHQGCQTVGKRIDKANRYGRHRLDAKMSDLNLGANAKPSSSSSNARKVPSATKKSSSSQHDKKHHGRHGHRHGHRHHHKHHRQRSHRIKRHNSYNRFKTSMLNREKKQQHITQVLLAAAAAVAASAAQGPSNQATVVDPNRGYDPSVDVHNLVRFNTNTFKNRGGGLLSNASFNDVGAVQQRSQAVKSSARRSRQLMTSCRVQKSYKTSSSRFSSSIRRRRQQQLNRLQRLTSIFNMRRSRKRANTPNLRSSKLVNGDGGGDSSAFYGPFSNANHHLNSHHRIDAPSKMAYCVSARSRRSESSSNFSSSSSSSSSSSCSSSDSSFDDDDDAEGRSSSSSSTDYTSSTINTSCSSMSSMSSDTGEESHDSSLMSDTDMVASSLADCLKTAHLNSGKEDFDDTVDNTPITQSKSLVKASVFKKASSNKGQTDLKTETIKLKKFKKRKLKTRPVSSSLLANAAAVTSKTASASTNSFKLLDVPTTSRTRPSRRSIFTSNAKNCDVAMVTQTTLATGQKPKVINALLTDSVSLTRRSKAAINPVLNTLINPVVMATSSTSSILIPGLVKPAANRDFLHAESNVECCAGAKSSSVIGSSIHSFDSMFNYKGSNTELNDQEFNSSSLNSSMNANCDGTASGRENAVCEDCFGVHHHHPFDESTSECAGGYKRKRDDHHLLKDVQMKATRRARLLGKSTENTANANEDLGINYNQEDLISNSMLDSGATASTMVDQESCGGESGQSKPCKSFYILNKTSGQSKLASLTPTYSGFGLKYDVNQSSDDTEYENTNENNEADEEDENDDEDDEEHDKGLFFKFDAHPTTTSSSKHSALNRSDARYNSHKRYEEEEENFGEEAHARCDLLADEADDEQSDWPSNEKSSKPIMIASSQIFPS